jgi:hypothetical protein
MTATESLLPEIINDFFNKIGTLLPRADAAACPQLAEADIRALAERSGFDPSATLAVHCAIVLMPG